MTNPPLKLALAQIQFPPILAINQPNSPVVAAFQEDLRKDYPHYQGEVGIALNDTDALVNASSVPRHVFRSDFGWNIYLTQNFVSLTTTCYRTREDFAEKVRRIAESTQKCLAPHHAIRLGIRFVDRIEGEAVKKIDQYVTPAFLGPLAMLHTNTESMITRASLIPSESEAKGMIIHWGYLPPNQPFEFQEVEPYPDTCWVLDSDIQSGKYEGFDPVKIAHDTMVLTGRTYAFFRHVFNDKFLISCGGKP